MKSPGSKTLTWREILNALRSCEGSSVFIRDGRALEAAGSVRTRPSAKGSELCLFPGEGAVARTALIEQLETLSASAGRRFMAAARAKTGESALLVDGVADEDVDGKSVTVVRTRRPRLGFNRSEQSGSSTTLRTKRIKVG